MAGSDWLVPDSSPHTTFQGDRRRSPQPDNRARGPSRSGACATLAARWWRRPRRFAQNAAAHRRSYAERETPQPWQPCRSRRRTQEHDRSRTRSPLWGESAWRQKSTCRSQTVRSRPREKALEWSDSSLEHRHLRRRTNHGILGSDALERDVVAEPCRDRLRPAAEVMPIPLESVVGMTKSTGWERTETHVVFGIGGGQRNDTGRGVLENRALEGCEALGVEVLDNLHHCSPIETCQPAVAIGQGAVEELHTRTLRLGKSLDPQSLLGT